MSRSHTSYFTKNGETITKSTERNSFTPLSKVSLSLSQFLRSSFHSVHFCECYLYKILPKSEKNVEIWDTFSLAPLKRLAFTASPFMKLKNTQLCYVKTYYEYTEFQLSTLINMGRDSSVGIATGYGLDGLGIESRWGARFFAHVQTGPGVHPASCTMGTGSSPGVKRPGRDADHTPPSSAEITKG
jgi:hypothetical protein